MLDLRASNPPARQCNNKKFCQTKLSDTLQRRQKQIATSMVGVAKPSCMLLDFKTTWSEFQKPSQTVNNDL